MKLFDIDIRRDFPASALADLSDAEAERADEDGYLGGNQEYRDLRGFNWNEVETTIERERRLIDRFRGARDSAAEEAAYDDERGRMADPAEELWGLDVGVAAATVALSALGAIPVASCNAGSFGNRHLADHPHVSFYAGTSSPELLVRLAEIADAGLSVHEGVADLYARSVLDLYRFAEAALEQSRLQSG